VAIKSFTELNAWQKSHELALDIYKVTKKYPKDELFGLTGQMRRCAVSVPSNIAEGFNRFSKKEKIQFYNISLGSAGELESQLFMARDLHYITDLEHKTLASQTEVVRKLISGMIKSLR
jgi:four helix bundle protein